MSTQQQPEYAIVGGGIAGLCLAAALLERKINVTVYEQAHKFGEIGAGVAFSPNAVRAMAKCAPGVYQGFWKVATHNVWESKKNVYFDFLDGYHQEKDQEPKLLFSTENETGANSVHRAHYLDELIKVVPQDKCRFNKHLDNVSEGPDGRLTLKFHDGSEAVADAIIGCDGIKSRVRQIILGDDNKASYPHYSHKYAYRGLIPADKAIKALGEDYAVNAKAYLGPDGHVLTFPVDHGSTMNVVAFHTDKNDWPDTSSAQAGQASHHTRLTLPTKKSSVTKDFAGWGAQVSAILDMLNDDLDCWAIFDTADHPMPFFNKGRLVVVGDAAHATSPHHGSGAGFCIEDAAVLAELLADTRVVQGGVKGIEKAFESFDASRRERTQWLVQSSRFCGEMYDWKADGIGEDAAKIEAELHGRNEKIWRGDIDEMCADALKDLNARF